MPKLTTKPKRCRRRPIPRRQRAGCRNSVNPTTPFLSWSSLRVASKRQQSSLVHPSDFIFADREWMFAVA